MSGKRAKWIRKQMGLMNPRIFKMIENEYKYHERAREYPPRRLYRTAKRFWSQNKQGIENW